MPSSEEDPPSSEYIFCPTSCWEFRTLTDRLFDRLVRKR